MTKVSQDLMGQPVIREPIATMTARTFASVVYCEIWNVKMVSYDLMDQYVIRELDATMTARTCVLIVRIVHNNWIHQMNHCN